MTEDNKFTIKGMNYKLLVKLDYWTIKDAVTYLTAYSLEDKSWDTNEAYQNELSNMFSQINEIVTRSVKANKLEITRVYVEDFDEESAQLYDALNIPASKVDSKTFIAWASKKGLDMPPEFEAIIKKSYLKDVTTVPNDVNSETSAISTGSDEEMPQDIKDMSVPMLRKKVKELSNEKIKWDKSIIAATRVGLLFYENNLQMPAKENDFKNEFKKYLEYLPDKTITRIWKSLPVAPIQYKKTGEAPTKQHEGIDDETLDMIIEAAVASGILSTEEKFKDAKELEKLFTRFEFDIPTEKYLKIISGAVKRVLKKYNQANI